MTFDMLLYCPRCLAQHVDAPNPGLGWTNPPHSTHSCHNCGLLWRPSNTNTNGVARLPVLEIKHIERVVAADPNLYRVKVIRK